MPRIASTPGAAAAGYRHRENRGPAAVRGRDLGWTGGTPSKTFDEEIGLAKSSSGRPQANGNLRRVLAPGGDRDAVEGEPGHI
jgi:hypothetical protein